MLKILLALSGFSPYGFLITFLSSILILPRLEMMSSTMLVSLLLVLGLDFDNEHLVKLKIEKRDTTRAFKMAADQGIAKE